MALALPVELPPQTAIGDVIVTFPMFAGPATKHLASLAAHIFNVIFHPGEIAIDPTGRINRGHRLSGLKGLTGGHGKLHRAGDVIGRNKDFPFIETLFPGCICRHHFDEGVLTSNLETNCRDCPFIGLLSGRKSGNGLERAGDVSNWREKNRMRDDSHVIGRGPAQGDLGAGITSGKEDATTLLRAEYRHNSAPQSGKE